VHFGSDYYMYVGVRGAGAEAQGAALERGLFVEPFISPYPRVLCVRSLARWRGFLASPDLRSRVRSATAKIVRSLGVGEVIWVPDWFLNDWPTGEVLTIDAMRSHLLGTLGSSSALPGLGRRSGAGQC